MRILKIRDSRGLNMAAILILRHLGGVPGLNRGKLWVCCSGGPTDDIYMAKVCQAVCSRSNCISPWLYAETIVEPLGISNRQPPLNNNWWIAIHPRIPPFFTTAVEREIESELCVPLSSGVILWNPLWRALGESILIYDDDGAPYEAQILPVLFQILQQ